MKLTVSTVVSKSLETPYISEVTVAPAKGVGRVERRESSNLSFSAKHRNLDLQGCGVFVLSPDGYTLT